VQGLASVVASVDRALRFHVLIRRHTSGQARGVAIPSGRLRLLGAPERKSRDSVPSGRTRHAHEWHHRPAAKKLASRPPSVRSPAATSFRPAKCPSCSASRTRRSTPSRAAASSRRGALGAVGSSSATGLPPRSHRSTSPGRGGPPIATSGATKAGRRSKRPERYSKALLQTGNSRARDGSQPPKPPPCRHSKQRERRDSNPRPPA
jgi:hypothetical protein